MTKLETRDLEGNLLRSGWYVRLDSGSVRCDRVRVFEAGGGLWYEDEVGCWKLPAAGRIDPSRWVRTDIEDERGLRTVESGGVSLRDWFAGTALVGLLSNPTLKVKRDGEEGDERGLTKACYLVADAMLVAGNDRTGEDDG